MKKLFATTISAAAILFSAGALAEQPSYNYAEIEYLDADPADGWGIHGSFEIDETLFWQIGYSEADTSVFGINIDGDNYFAALGARTALSDNTSLYGMGSLVRAEVSTSFASESDTGYGVEVGVRSNVTEMIELQAGLSYIDIFDDTDTVGHLKAVFHLNDSFAITAGSTVESDKVYSLGVRYNF